MNVETGYVLPLARDPQRLRRPDVSYAPPAAAARLVSLLAAVVLAGCGPAPEAGPGLTVRDSAGIRIVENDGPAWRDGEGWTVAPEPLVEIGGTGGDDPLYMVRSPLRLADGRIVFANGGEEIRFHDASGAFLGRAGGRGQGPGEFLDLQLLFRYRGDSLLAWDTRGERAGSVLDREGAFGRRIRLPATVDGDRTSLVQHVLADGSLLGWILPLENPWPEERRDGRDLAVHTLVRFTAEGEAVAPFGTFPDGVCTRLGELPWCYPAPFEARGAFASGGARFHAAFPERFEVEVRDLTGELREILRRTHELLRVTPEQIEAYRWARLAGAPEGQREAIERESAGLTFPSHMPAFVSLLVDLEGNLWVEEASDLRTLRGSAVFPPPELDEPPLWSVFDPGGMYLGAVTLPPRLRVSEIGSDYVLGVAVSELGVESVRMYRLRKPGS